MNSTEAELRSVLKDYYEGCMSLNLPKYPNIVKGLIPDHPNQVWGSDITYQVICPEKNSADCDFVYLSLITDAYTKSIKA